jgi:hypothetical protein
MPQETSSKTRPKPVSTSLHTPRTIFILSPAHLGGKRAELLSRPTAKFELAHRLQRGEPVPLGEVYSFVSGLYFRGKLAYGNAFATRIRRKAQVFTITPNRGLVHVDTPVTLADLAQMGEVDIDHTDERYHSPLRRDVIALAKSIGPHGRVILLGSIATAKYVTLLLDELGDRLLFPTDFVGRGDLSRGGLCLRAVADNSQLPYAPVAGATRTGKRPPKLDPSTRPKPA